jgi:thymidine phosphorylase
VDFSVGVECLKKEGDAVERGEPIVRVHSRQPIDSAVAAKRIMVIA